MAFKNSSNNLSDLDFGSLLKDSHNMFEHALDVIAINEPVPHRFHQSTIELKDMGDGTKEVEFVNFWNQGVKEKSIIMGRNYPLGKGEITVVSFVNNTANQLGGKYFIIYDDLGEVGVWFNLDLQSVEPVTGALRNIEVTITQNDTIQDLAEKLKLTLIADGEFNAIRSGSSTIIQSITIGDKSDAHDSDSNLTIVIYNGSSSINSKYFFIYSANDETKYYVWFNVDGTGINPSPVGATEIEVALLNTDSAEIMATKIKDAINVFSLDFLSEVKYNEANEYYTEVINRRFGETTHIEDVNTNLYLRVEEDGENQQIVARYQAFYDIDNIQIRIEKII